jgi:uncharacterized protein (DUF1330 family)
MPAYWCARSHITDPAKYKRYTDQIPGIMKTHHGKVLARGSRFQILEGPKLFTRFVVIEFPTFDDAVGCFNSQQYQDAAAHRRDGGGEVELVVLESGDETK